MASAVVHEMVHMIYKDNSHKFWDKVATVIPDYGGRRLWFRGNGISWIFNIIL